MLNLDHMIFSKFPELILYFQLQPNIILWKQEISEQNHLMEMSLKEEVSEDRCDLEMTRLGQSLR